MTGPERGSSSLGDASASRERWIARLIFLCGFLAGLGEFARRHFAALIVDEWAYLLQADTFARGHLSLPAPPAALAQFFEAPQMLVAPVYAAKYDPGTAALFAPFVALGIPWLLPCICLGASGAMLYKIARNCGLSLAGSLVAAMCICLLPASTLIIAAYLSHSIATALSVGAIYYLFAKQRRPLEWWAPGAMIGFCLLTRPLNALALCAVVSLLAVVSPAGLREKLERLAALALPTLAALGLLFLYYRHITGDWRLSPWALWARQYTPFDGMGIGPPSSAAPLREIPPQLAFTVNLYRHSRLLYTWPQLGKVVVSRLIDWIECIPSPLLLPLIGFGLSRLRAAPRTLWLIGLSVLLFLLQLGFHATLLHYFSEMLPGLGLIVGMGVDKIVDLWKRIDKAPRLALAAVFASSAGILLFATYAHTIDVLQTSYADDMKPISTGLVMLFAVSSLAIGFSSLGTSPRLSKGIFAGFLGTMLLLSPLDILMIQERNWGTGKGAECAVNLRDTYRCLVQREVRFEEKLDEVRAAHGLVFVTPNANDDLQEYPLVNPGLGVDSNVAVIVATDLGERDSELMKRYPERPAFRLSNELELTRLK